MNIVWFKRDLRIEDHLALLAASKKGVVLPLYIVEPEFWQQSSISHRHYAFLSQSLIELNQSLENLGQKLIIKIGSAVEVLEEIQSRQVIESLYSHQETWNFWTYQRDLKVKKWAQSASIPWYQPAQNGVIRGLKDRDGWALRWYKQMKKPLLKPPQLLQSIDERSCQLPEPKELGLEIENLANIQTGGRSKALALLESFLYQRGENYTKAMSSPVTAFESCSRLSAHLAFGTVSIREVFQACERRKDEIKLIPRGTEKGQKSQKGKWSTSLRSFSGRLRWHCHFIQKLEDQPTIEFKNMHSGYDGLRSNDSNDDFNQQYFHAWKSGKTGYPMIDACMRALTTTGWINFRMRAMLISFASYHLWLDWKEPSLHLAKLFTDYEPGIHYSQVQMQSGTTGINAIRIYNPIKQGIDQDPEGKFIRTWIPELIDMDQELIHTPWQNQAQMGEYPMPIVDEKIARKAAADQVYGLRKNNPSHREIAEKIYQKHGSRRRFN